MLRIVGVRVLSRSVWLHIDGTGFSLFLLIVQARLCTPAAFCNKATHFQTASVSHFDHFPDTNSPVLGLESLFVGNSETHRRLRTFCPSMARSSWSPWRCDGLARGAAGARKRGKGPAHIAPKVGVLLNRIPSEKGVVFHVKFNLSQRVRRSSPTCDQPI